MAESEEYVDPFEAHTKREPLRRAGVHVVVLSFGTPERAQAIADALVKTLAGAGRTAQSRVIDVGDDRGHALERGLQGATLPLVLVTTGAEPWTRTHLDPLLKSIDKCDHAVGRRPAGAVSGLGRRLGAFWRGRIFGAPVLDVHSPCRLHRLERLRAITLQSKSAFVDLEVLAKATFLGHLLDEVDVPALATADLGRPSWGDFFSVFRNPTFVRRSGPAEDLQGDDERHDRPGREDGHGGSNVQDTRPLKHHAPQGADELGQGKSLNNRLHGVRESVGAEEHTGEEPHRQHDQVHQPADGFRALSTAGDQKADPGEREPHPERRLRSPGAGSPDRHMERLSAEEEEDRQVGEQKGEPRP